MLRRLTWTQLTSESQKRSIKMLYLPFVLQWTCGVLRTAHGRVYKTLFHVLPRKFLYVHPAPPAQQADTLTFKSLHRAHLKRALKCKRWPRPEPPANLTPRCNRQVFSQPIGLLVACADVSDAQEVPRVAGPDVGKIKILMKLISRRRTHVGVEGPQEAREVY